MNAEYPIEEVQSLYKKINDLTLLLKDANETIAELNKECDELIKDRQKQDTALKAISSSLHILKIQIDKEIALEDNTLSRDYMPFFNAMAAYGVNGYAKKKREKKAKD